MGNAQRQREKYMPRMNREAAVTAGPIHFAGIDGGATKTLCLVATKEGRILGLGRAGPSNFHNIGRGAALSNLKLALDSACDDALVRMDEIAVACFGLAGLDSPADERILKKAITKREEFARSNMVVHDSQMAVVAALAGRPGVIVNAGTGSVAGGINSAGESVRVGGWGNIIGDEGSGYAIGQGALRACMRAFDGRGPQTSLLGPVLTRLGVDSAQDIVESVYVKKMTVAEMAGVSSLVTEAARKGDRVARSILEEAGHELAEMATTVARRLSLERAAYDVATVGSVFSSPPVINAFTEELRERSPMGRIVSPAFPQVFGSVMLAMRKGGVETTTEVVANLASSMRRLPKAVVPNLRSLRPRAR
jgi:N-acetylglucosamine kinase-like BadF-type ATPase